MNINQVQNDIQNLEEKIEKGKAILSKAEGKLETLEQQKKVLESELLSYGITPTVESLDSAILNLEGSIEQELNEIKKLVPESLR